MGYTLLWFIIHSIPVPDESGSGHRNSFLQFSTSQRGNSTQENVLSRLHHQIKNIKHTPLIVLRRGQRSLRLSTLETGIQPGPLFHLVRTLCYVDNSRFVDITVVAPWTARDCRGSIVQWQTMTVNQLFPVMNYPKRCFMTHQRSDTVERAPQLAVGAVTRTLHGLGL